MATRGARIGASRQLSYKSRANASPCGPCRLNRAMDDTPETGSDRYGPAAWGADLRRAAVWLTCLPLGTPAAGAEEARETPKSELPESAPPESAPPTSAPPTPVRAFRAFPLVGAALGLAAGAVYALADGFGLAPLAAGLIAVAFLAALGCARFERALAAVADGLGEAGVAARIQRLAADRLGAAGGLVLILSVALRAGALAAIAAPGAAAGALLGAAAASRGGIALLLYRGDSASAGAAPDDTAGDGADADPAAAPDRPSAETVTLAAILSALFALMFPGLVPGLLALVVGLAVLAAFAGLLRRRLGRIGRAGLGAVQQAVETAMLLAYAAAL